MKTRSLLAVAALALAACETVAPVAPPVVGTSIISSASKAPFGAYLVDDSGRALYILEGTRNESGMMRCSGECFRVWPPMHGLAIAGAGVDRSRLAIVPMRGGTYVTYAGWPLYYYHRDRAPGDTTGQHVVDRWGTWHLLSPNGEPIRPVGRAD